MSRREHLRDAALLARPANAPRVHLPDALRAFLAQQPRQPLVAEPATGRKRVVIVVAPVVGRLGPERGRNRHLRHHGGAAAADQAALGEHDVYPRARGRDRRIHAGASRPDDQDIGLNMHGFMAHAEPRSASLSSALSVLSRAWRRCQCQ